MDFTGAQSFFSLFPNIKALKIRYTCRLLIFAALFYP